MLPDSDSRKEHTETRFREDNAEHEAVRSGALISTERVPTSSLVEESSMRNILKVILDVIPFTGKNAPASKVPELEAERDESHWNTRAGAVSGEPKNKGDAGLIRCVQGLPGFPERGSMSSTNCRKVGEQMCDARGEFDAAAAQEQLAELVPAPILPDVVEYWGRDPRVCEMLAED